MKRILALGIGSILTLPLVVSTVVFAQDGTTTTTQTESSQLSPEQIKEVKLRVEKRKAEIKTRLSNLEKINLQNKCKAAQGSLSSVEGRIKGLETSRTQVYSNVVARLTELSVKLKERGSDTTALDAAIVTLQEKITVFNSTLANYKLAVSDLSDMDCKTDPEGFKASLLAARTALEAAKAEANAVKSYVKDTIKPELKTIRAALESKSTEEDQ